MISKRGSEFDIIFIMGLELLMMIGILFSVKILDVFDAKAKPFLNTSSAGAAVFNTAENKVVPMFDNIFFFMFVGLCFIAMVSALFIRTHPVFFILSIFLIIIALILSSLFSNIANIFMNSNLLSYQSFDFNFPKMNFLFDNLPLIVIGLSILLVILLYSFGRSQVF